VNHSQVTIGKQSLQAMVALLDHLKPEDAPGNTVDEFAKAWGCCEQSARTKVGKLVALGKLKRSGWRHVPRSDKGWNRKPVYQPM
jgi:hypothetical protein